MLKGKTAIVTGGSRGIGAAISLKLAAQGADLAIVYAGNASAAEDICHKIEDEYGVKARAYQCNVADFNAVKELVGQIKAEFGTAHILVNNAGITKDGLAAMMSEEAFDQVMDINLKGAFNMIRHCIGLFIRNKEGSIINITSVSGLMGNAGQCNYSASKAGLVGLTKSIAKELFALLVDRRGGFVTSEEAISFLWEDETVNPVTLARYRKVALRLKNILEEYGISQVVEAVDGKRRIVTDMVKCDLFDYLSGRPECEKLFKGSYLTNYSWGENTLGELTRDSLY